MRRNIIHIGAGELHYEICSIAETALTLTESGLDIYWENIGDPILKGQKLPQWLKDIVSQSLGENATYGYSPTKGTKETRDYLVTECNNKGGATITPEDIIFFNGIGDAASKIFGMLKRTARLLAPSPSYMTHVAAEASHAGAQPVPFYLDPANNWLPDLEELEDRIQYNPAVAGIMLVNPENPTGLVYPEDTLRKIVDLAARYDMFVLVDEVYENILYNGQSTLSLAEVIGDVPGIAMKSISKEMPWPGARCGWIEVYNRTNDECFERYFNSILNAKMLEVCSTTLPQLVLPKIVSHPQYKPYVTDRVKRYEKFANISHEILSEIDGITANRSNGAFYQTVFFNADRLRPDQRLPITNTEVRKKIEELVSPPATSPDTRFTLYLLGATGICVVPLSSFNTELQGFRMTLLEQDESTFRKVMEILKLAISEYLNSASE